MTKSEYASFIRRQVCSVPVFKVLCGVHVEYTLKSTKFSLSHPSTERLIFLNTNSQDPNKSWHTEEERAFASEAD